MTTIEIKCRGCGKTYSVARTSEIKPNVDYLGCNWCPECEPEDYYKEWPVYKIKPVWKQRWPELW